MVRALASLATVAALLGAVVTQTHAVVVISNLDQHAPGWYSNINFDQHLAKAFTVGDTFPEFTLDSITMRLSGSGPDNADYPLELAIYSNIAGLPGAALFSLTGDNPTNEAEYQYTPTSPQSLISGETYWIVASTDGYIISFDDYVGGQYLWYESNSSSITTYENWISGATAFRSSGFPDWQGTNENFFYQIVATGIPEPSGLGLLLLGLACLAGRRKKII